VLTEPSPRDSMAAIGLAAAVLAETEPDLIVGSFAADHVIGDEAAFRATIRQAVATAREGFLVTVGITATGPSTAFGYIESGAALDISGALDACRVAGFTEKPDAQTAAEYLATGRYRWNAGMFVARVDVLLGHLAEQKPALHDGLREIARVWDTPGRQDALDRIWPGLERISIDHAIAEPVAAAGGVATVPGEFPWNDVGDFAALAAELPEGQVLGDAASVRMLESPGGIVVAGTGRLIATVGLPDVVVVDTPDALLVTTKDRAQQVKDVVDLLRADDRTDLL
jgi:mannose-1-phosphate guanylyltransferase